MELMEKRLLEFYKHSLKHYTRVQAKKNGCALEHAAWMIDEMLAFLEEPNPDLGKVNRWIGFIQGVFWKESFYTIDQMRYHVIEAKDGTLGVARPDNP